MKRTEQYSDQIARLYPSKKVKTDDGQRILTQSITFQVTDDCNLACLYCYQGHKGKNRMSFETAKKFFDLVVSGEKGFKILYQSREISWIGCRFHWRRTFS